jgi:hypothetical protein
MVMYFMVFGEIAVLRKEKKFNYVDIKWNKYFRLKLMENI